MRAEDTVPLPRDTGCCPGSMAWPLLVPRAQPHSIQAGPGSQQVSLLAWLSRGGPSQSQVGSQEVELACRGPPSLMGLEAPPLSAGSRASGRAQGTQNDYSGPSPRAGWGLKSGAAQQGKGSSKGFSTSCPWPLLALKQSPHSFPCTFGWLPLGQRTQESPGHNRDPHQRFPFSLQCSTVHLPCTRRFKPNGDGSL